MKGDKAVKRLKKLPDFLLFRFEWRENDIPLQSVVVAYKERIFCPFIHERPKIIVQSGILLKVGLNKIRMKIFPWMINPIKD